MNLPQETKVPLGVTKGVSGVVVGTVDGVGGQVRRGLARQSDRYCGMTAGGVNIPTPSCAPSVKHALRLCLRDTSHLYSP